MKRDDIIKFFEHIGSRQASHGVKYAFRFKQYLSSRKKGTLMPAKYPGPNPGSTGTGGVVSYSSMSRDHTRDRAGDQLGLGRLHAHVCRIITCLSEPISIESDPPYPPELELWSQGPDMSKTWHNHLHSPFKLISIRHMNQYRHQPLPDR